MNNYNNLKMEPDDGSSMQSIEMDLIQVGGADKCNQQNTQNINNRGGPNNLLSLVHHKWRKIWKRDSAPITPTDPSFKTTYLGNVVTTWAKGEGALERPASALWKNHCQGRGSIRMLISVAPSGLKAQTREHGLTEYWANRLTWCGVPPDYPKLFCWIYRHEGRKLKQELRCHAVLCSKELQAQRLSSALKGRLTEALFDFKKEKILRQNARLSIVQSLYNESSAAKRPQRPPLLNTNSQNYKPPLERSKSAPKLSCIEEFEEEDEEDEENKAATGGGGNNDLVEMIPEDEEPVVEVVVETTSESVTPPPHNDKEEIRISHRKSYPNGVTHNPGGGPPRTPAPGRPHTVPMDAKLNLPYMTGYDKVMQLLECSASHEHLLAEDDGFSGGAVCCSDSEPLPSSPGGSDGSEGSSSCSEDLELDKGHLHLLHHLQGVREEDEIGDNVSDESGFSEEGRRGTTTTAAAHDHHTLNWDKNLIILNFRNKKDLNTSSPTALTQKLKGSQPLIVYDNVCFDI